MTWREPSALRPLTPSQRRSGGPDAGGSLSAGQGGWCADGAALGPAPGWVFSTGRQTGAAPGLPAC